MNTSSAPALSASASTRRTPYHNTRQVPTATITSTIGASRALRLRARKLTVDVVAAFAIETLLFIAFARKRLDDARGRDRFLHHRRERALLLLDLAGRVLDAARIAVDHHEQRRRHRQADQTEAPVEIEHHRHHADDGDEIEADLQDRRDEVFRRVDVARQPHHHVAGLLLLIEGQRHPLDVVVEAMPQVDSRRACRRCWKNTCRYRRSPR